MGQAADELVGEAGTRKQSVSERLRSKVRSELLEPTEEEKRKMKEQDNTRTRLIGGARG